MTARQIFEATLIELSKVQAPSLKLYEFNYLFNKTINQYVNKIYNIYDINQQTTDDLRVLKSTVYLTPKKVNNGDNLAIKNISTEGNIQDTKNPNMPAGGYTGKATSYLSKKYSSIQSLHGATYEVYLPQDYLHMLNCVCIYYVAKQKDCWDAGSYIEVPATRLTSDSWSQIVTDIYNRPSPMRPYYYIHNINSSSIVPTNPDTDMIGTYKVTTNGTWENDTFNPPTNPEENSNFPRSFELGDKKKTSVSLIEKPIALRHGNPSTVRCEIRYGKDDSLFQLAEVQIDYVKVPQFIRLTQEQIDLTEDTSQIMEFPDYVNQEIINELVHLVMERSNNPRLSNNIQMTQSIARPTGQQQQQPQQA